MPNSVPLRLFARRSAKDHIDVNRFFKADRLAIEFFEKKFAAAFPFEKLDSLIVPEFHFGAMENVGAVTYAEEKLAYDPANPIVKNQIQVATLPMVQAHEIGHMWFGNQVTAKWWNEFWANESFAEFLSHWALGTYEQKLGMSNTWLSFDLSRKARAYSTERQAVKEGEGGHPVWAEASDSGTFFQIVDLITYSKGATVLRQLQHQAGFGNFEQAIQNYYAAYQGKNVTRQEFTRAFAGSLRMADFPQWADLWFGTQGFNSVQADFSCEDGKVDSFKLLQGVALGDSVLRPHHTQVSLFTMTASGGLKPVTNVDVTYKEEETEVAALVGSECPDLVMPNSAYTDYVEVRLDEVSKKTLEGHLRKGQPSSAEVWALRKWFPAQK